MEKPLAGKKVAILIANGFDEIVMTDAQRALLAAGATVKTISPENGLSNGWHGTGWGHYFPVDTGIAEALSADFDMLIVPDGTRGILKLAGTAHSKRIVRGFLDADKPVALKGAAVELLALSDRAQGRTVAVEGELAAKLSEAGAKASGEAQTIDNVLLTATEAAETAGFIAGLIELFASAPELRDAA
ncbi:MAG: peptidase [Rhodospirillales bacterium]|jgi:protease I|nr:peptidase [Rhodospirillales bacterium]